MNLDLIAKGSNVRLLTVEYITNGEDQAAGQTIYSKIVGNKQLGHDFVPFDPRRTWSGPTDGGEPTDIDNNGKVDVAFREIYYDYDHTWSTDGSAIDLESVSVHETGHGLSQAHFGSVAVLHPDTPKARLRVSPRAVMNALYTGSYRDLGGSDNGGHCSNWGQWPNN